MNPATVTETARNGDELLLDAGSNRVWTRLRNDRAGRFGLTIVIAYLLVAVGVWFGLLGQDWADASGGRWDSPSAGHWLGTNILGQDIFQRAIYSTRVAFEIGLVVALASTLLGSVLGSISGWYAHRWPDDVVVWIMGVLDSIPFYLFVAAVAYALQGQAWSMHLAMIATFWTGTARLVRGEVMRIREQEFVLSARAIGLPTPQILIRHIVPNTIHILLIQAGIVFVAAIKTEVILSFLGLGVQDGVSWGLMLAESTQEVQSGHFGNFMAASVLLFVLLLGFNLLTDAVQDAVDPRQSAL